MKILSDVSGNIGLIDHEWPRTQSFLMSDGLKDLTLSTVKPCSKKQLSGSDAETFFKPLLLNHDFDENELKLTQLPNIDAFFIDNVLSINECDCAKDMINAEESRELSFWNNNVSNEEDNLSKVKLFRDCNTIELNCHMFSNLLWKRIEPLLSKLTISINDNDENDDVEYDMIGTWNAVTTNHDLLFARYPINGHFAPHTDGRAVHLFNLRSLYSIILFLNDIPLVDGGGTRFYESQVVNELYQDNKGRWTGNSNSITGQVEAKAGRMLIFHQSLVHEGIPSLYLEKYIIRSDIIFERKPAIEINEDAYQYYRDAETLAEDGFIEKSISNFKKAFAMDVNLKDIMRQ